MVLEQYFVRKKITLIIKSLRLIILCTKNGFKAGEMANNNDLSFAKKKRNGGRPHTH